MNRDNVQKAIGQVAKELDLPTHVLRFWETQFPEYLHPHTGIGNRRYYTEHDIGVIRQIKNYLYNDGYSIKGLRKKFADEEFDSKWQVQEQDLVQQINYRFGELERQLQELNQSFQEIMDY